MLKHYQDWFQSKQEKVTEDLCTFLKFPSISTDPAYQSSLRECADWLCQELKAMGFAVEVWKTSGHPVVYASYLHAGSDSPTLLFYQHYDVQPAVPLEEWKSDPFEPTIQEGKVYARGAVDNKGQCFYVLTALRAFLELSRSCQLNLKVVIEGEEEVGSLGLEGVLEEKKQELQADHVFVTDFDMLEEGQPAITLGMRGIASVNVTCRNSNADLHSGSFGGVVMNPARALVEALAACFDEKGGVAIPGFYDGVKPLSKEQQAAFYWDFDIREHTRSFDVKAFSSEEGYSLLESNWLRPTLEINGLESGYTGEGVKTIIPALAMVKLSCRLVPGQDPDHVIECITTFLKKKLPDGIEVSLEVGHGGRGYLSSPQSKVVQVVAQAYEEVFQAPCRRILCGATIPVIPELARVSGGELIMMGVGLPEDGMHSPNESFSLKRFKQGFLATTQLLEMMNGEDR